MPAIRLVPPLPVPGRALIWPAEVDPATGLVSSVGELGGARNRTPPVPPAHHLRIPRPGMSRSIACWTVLGSCADSVE